MRTISKITLTAAVLHAVVACMPTDIETTSSSDIDADCELLNANLLIRSSSDARALPLKCFQVAGDIDIIGSDLTDLEALGFLRQVNVLRIKDNPILRTTAGLDRVRVMQHLEVDNNPMLGDLGGLGRTEEIRRMTITKNPALSDLQGLRSVRGIGAGGLTIRDNESIDDLEDFESLQLVDGALRIENNRGTASLKTFNRLEAVGELVVAGNKSLRTIGLNIQAVRGNLTVVDNPDLASLDGFGDLESIGGNLTVERNTGLTLINGFTAKFQSVGGNLSLDGNTALNDIYDLAINLYSVGGSLIATNNTALSQCRADDLNQYIEIVGGAVDIGDNGAEWNPCH